MRGILAQFGGDLFVHSAHHVQQEITCSCLCFLHVSGRRFGGGVVLLLALVLPRIPLHECSTVAHDAVHDHACRDGGVTLEHTQNAGLTRHGIGVPKVVVSLGRSVDVACGTTNKTAKGIETSGQGMKQRNWSRGVSLRRANTHTRTGCDERDVHGGDHVVSQRPRGPNDDLVHMARRQHTVEKNSVNTQNQKECNATRTADADLRARS